MSGSFFVTSGLGWQSGDPNLNKPFDQGSPTLPAPGTFGTNRPGNRANGRGNMQFFCVHEDGELKGHEEEHFHRFLFRVEDKDTNTRRILDNYQRLMDEMREATERSKDNVDVYRFHREGDDKAAIEKYAICHMFNHQQLNYVLAKAAYQDKTELSFLDLQKIIRPIGINLTPAGTAKYTQGFEMDLRVMTISGRSYMINELGPNAKENDNIYAVFTPYNYKDSEEKLYYRVLGKEGNTVEVEKKKETAPQTVSEDPRFFWQVHLRASAEPPPTPICLVDQDGLKREILGFSMRLGKIEHKLLEQDKSPAAFFGSETAVGKGLPKHRDSYSSVFYPTITVLVDLYDTTPIR